MRGWADDFKRQSYKIDVRHRYLCSVADPDQVDSCRIWIVMNRAVDPHSLYADPDPAVFLNADPDPGPGLA